jgi:2-keto-4-pentenoate hydratase/2-oxohepta-3-ene-1,7-dioic acid hydratase in catechol pathway
VSSLAAGATLAAAFARDNGAKNRLASGSYPGFSTTQDAIMRLFQFDDGGRAAIGAAVSDREFIDVSAVDPRLPRDLQTVLSESDGLDRARAAVSKNQARRPVADARFLPLIARPNAIWALALNFKRHIEETGLTTSTVHPHVFLRMPASIVAHGAPLLCPPPEVARAYDYEGELAVVIGKGGRHIPRDKALDHVAGFTCFNEGSVREYQSHNRQFGLGKNFEQSGSCGPWLVTRDEMPDYKSARLVTRLDGIERQNSLLSDLLFDVEQVISYLSSGYALRVGDIIAMGTPGAIPREDPNDIGNDLSKQFGPIKVKGLVHMRPGSIVEVEISGIGTLRNPIVADRPHEYRAA